MINFNFKFVKWREIQIQIRHFELIFP